MGLKFLNKKGWHTGSLRNIENVWKAEQKHDAEQKKLEELRKQIHEERERKEFRLLQEQAGLVPKQERLEFLYDSGLAVGNRSSEGFKALEPYPGADNEASAATGVSSSSKESSVPGALFEEKPQSANDAWRKLHSDPLLMIRQREQEAMARIKNNPVKMAMIRKSVEEKKQDGKNLDEKHGKAKSKHKRHSSSKHQSVSEDDRLEERERRRESKHKQKEHQDTNDESRGRSRHHRDSYRASEYDKQRRSNPGEERSRRIDRERSTRNNEMSKHERSCSYNRKDESTKETSIDSHQPNESRNESHKCRSRAPKLSEEERAARLREMQQDAELHEEQRWRRLKKADEDDARDAKHSTVSMGRSFLDAAHKSVYGAEKGGSSTIEESVRRRTHFLQGRSEADERNAFRR